MHNPPCGLLRWWEIEKCVIVRNQLCFRLFSYTTTITAAVTVTAACLAVYILSDGAMPQRRTYTELEAPVKSIAFVFDTLFHFFNYNGTCRKDGSDENKINFKAQIPSKITCDDKERISDQILY